DHADFLAPTQFVGRGELGDGGGFADPGRADERDREGAAVLLRAGRGQRARDGDVRGEVAQDGLTDDVRRGEFIAAEFLADLRGDLVGEVCGELVFDEFGVDIGQGVVVET